MGGAEPTGKGELLLTMLGCRSEQGRPPLGVKCSSSPPFLWANSAAWRGRVVQTPTWAGALSCECVGGGLCSGVAAQHGQGV